MKITHVEQKPDGSTSVSVEPLLRFRVGDRLASVPVGSFVVAAHNLFLLFCIGFLAGLVAAALSQ